MDLLIVALLALVGVGFALLFAVIEESEEAMGYVKRFAPTVFTVALVLMGVRAFLPTSKEMCAILVVPRIANSHAVDQLGGKVVDLAQEWLQELKPAKKEGK